MVFRIFVGHTFGWSPKYLKTEPMYVYIRRR
jgi:hypothetical protein